MCIVPELPLEPPVEAEPVPFALTFLLEPEPFGLTFLLITMSVSDFRVAEF